MENIKENATSLKAIPSMNKLISDCPNFQIVL
jgi:hypothetical protein